VRRRRQPSHYIKDTRLAEHATIDRRTLRASYFPLLYTVYLALELPAWSRNLVTRISRAAKVHLVDSGGSAPTWLERTRND
jgi:predicted AAA+ superfamily ATPase